MGAGTTGVGTAAGTMVVAAITAVVIMAAATVMASVTPISAVDIMAARGSGPSRDTLARTLARSAMRPCALRTSAMQ
ncbi:hypothetical protein GCM10007857_29050 [Bradyrhizobium iriomotense]|uniref:Uncharacterized protein n=1 Tax=Bradyrhizobium iriomotense TaxID=441950 RepID=A0ABQ6AYQ3_9BRAD|nr:hypothetical protein GCM10007857_29050 [Bradyrhizobium iriomotense]